MKPSSLAHVDALVARMPPLAPLSEAITRAAEVTARAFREGGKLLVCGNGGSAADSAHIVGELMKEFWLKRPLPAHRQDQFRRHFPAEGEALAAGLQGALPAVSLVDSPALSTAFANDARPELVFAQQVYGLGQPGDVLWCISTSGNSANVVQAARTARVLGLSIVALTGRGGGLLSGLADVAVQVPADETYQVQEYHLPVYHALCLALEQEFFGPDA